jgi:hypothetical protein
VKAILLIHLLFILNPLLLLLMNASITTLPQEKLLLVAVVQLDLQISITNSMIVVGTTSQELRISQDSTSKNNIFYNNQITRSSIGGNETADPNPEASNIKHKIHK